MYVNHDSGWPVIYQEDEETGKISPEYIMLSGSVGSGKSMAAEGLGAIFHKQKFKVIYLTDTKNIYETAFCMFKPVDKYHLRKLKKFKEPVEGIPANILHPFTLNIPERALPKITFYTIPVKHLGREELSFISETRQETSTIKILMDTISTLKSDEGLSHLIYNAEEKSETADTYKGRPLRSLDPDKFFTKGSQGGTGKTISHAIGLFNIFKENYMLTPENCALNLNLAREINDQEHITILTTKYVKDAKLKQFAIDSFLHELDRVLENNVAKYPIVIIIEEIWKLCPDNPEGYHIFLAGDIANICSTTRNKGKGVRYIFTTQTYFGVKKDIRVVCTKPLLGKTGSIDELDELGKKLRLNKQDIDTMGELEQGEFLTILNQGGEVTRFTDPMKIFLPPHRHAEEGTDFEELYAKELHAEIIKGKIEYVLGVMRSYKETIDYMEELIQVEQHKVLEMAKKYNAEIESKQSKKEEAAEARKEVEIIKKAKKDTKISELSLAQAKEWAKQYSEGKSYQEIAEANHTYKEKIRRAVQAIPKEMPGKPEEIKEKPLGTHEFTKEIIEAKDDNQDI